MNRMLVAVGLAVLATGLWGTEHCLNPKPCDDIVSQPPVVNKSPFVFIKENLATTQDPDGVNVSFGVRPHYLIASCPMEI